MTNILMSAVDGVIPAMGKLHCGGTPKYEGKSKSDRGKMSYSLKTNWMRRIY